MNALSLFANIGVAEAYLSDVGVKVVLANELVERRADLYSRIYPETQMITGDITDATIYNRIITGAKKANVDVILATPPCQGISRAGKQHKHDIRNLLILPVIRSIHDIAPRYVFIENVPQFLETFIMVDGQEIMIGDYIKKEIEQDYNLTFNIIDTKYYGVPQTRQRAILLLSRRDQAKQWFIPAPDTHLVTLGDAISQLPSLDPWVKDIPEAELLELFPNFYKKKAKAEKVSPWHTPPEHIKRQVITMMHTPTGKTAFDNLKYVPIKADGTPVSGYKSAYRRLRWCDPASTVTMDNRKISSQNNVHPGRYLGIDSNGDEVYSDARALTLFELMKVMSLPETWPLPLDVNIPFVRSIIGEGIPPLFVKRVFQNLLA